MEHFRKTWRSEVISSEGFSIRMVARTALLYKDGEGSLRLNSEAMAGPGFTVVLYSQDIPDTPTRPRATIVDNVERAFHFARWNLTLE